MSKFVDLTGKVFAGWTVLGPSGIRGGNAFWLCRCAACGKTRAVRRDHLCSGKSRSCRGCSKALGYWNQPRKDYREQVQDFHEYFVNALRGFLRLEPLYGGHIREWRGAREEGKGTPEKVPRDRTPRVDSWWMRSD